MLLLLGVKSFTAKYQKFDNITGAQLYSHFKLHHDALDSHNIALLYHRKDKFANKEKNDKLLAELKTVMRTIYKINYDDFS